MFKSHTKFGKLSTEGGNTCRQRKPGRFVVKETRQRNNLEIAGSPPKHAAASIFVGMYV